MNHVKVVIKYINQFSSDFTIKIVTNRNNKTILFCKDEYFCNPHQTKLSYWLTFEMEASDWLNLVRGDPWEAATWNCHQVYNWRHTECSDSGYNRNL